MHAPADNVTCALAIRTLQRAAALHAAVMCTQTALCPNECKHARDIAKFRVQKYLKYEKLGEHGDIKADVYHFDMSHVPEDQAAFKSTIESLSTLDAVLLSWRHDYVTRGNASGTSKSPERPTTKLEKITAQDSMELPLRM